MGTPSNPAPAGPSAPLVFISDASAEAERLTLALRTRGYQVNDVPLALLAHRVTVQRPAAIICDADADGAVETLERLRDESPAERLPVLLLGERSGAMERIDAALVAGAFARPVNVRELIGTVERLVGTPEVEPSPGSLPPSGRGGRVATSSRPPARPPPPSVVPPRSVRPDAPSAATIPLPPDLAGDPAPRESTDAPVVELSSGVQQVLASAERRLAEDRAAPTAGSDEPGPEADADGPLPPDVLAALEEPLDEDDVSDPGSSPEIGTAALTGAITGGRGHTRPGRTGMTSLGNDGTEAPESEPSLYPARAGTAIQGPALEMPPASELGEEEDARRARQQASTPKPPKPGLEDLKPEPGSLERISIPPATAIQPHLPDSQSGGSLPPVSVPGPERRASDARELSSTTPPVNRRDEQAEPRPPSAPPAGAREERPSDAPPITSRPDRLSEPPPSLQRRPSDSPSAPERDRPSDAPLPRPGSAPAAEEALAVPSVLRAGDTILAIAKAIRMRFTGALALEVDEGIRRIVFREGDFVTVASGVHAESLVAFLASRGDLPAEVARQAHKLPAFGRRAGAALIAQGHLTQDQLWPVLRAHAEWLIGRACRIPRGGAGVEDKLIDRLQDEPAVFGGATGAEILVDVVRRVVPPEEALERLGGPTSVFGAGPGKNLLGECALLPMDAERVQNADGKTVAELIGDSADPSLTSALYGLVALGVLTTEGARARPAEVKKAPRDVIDDDAVRGKILARKALVDEGDYFALLGVGKDATGYDIKRAYSSLRREFEPSSVLTSGTADLGDVVTEIVEVLEEAYEVLGDERRRERYRRAIEAVPG